jgi:hypothetical protein
LRTEGKNKNHMKWHRRLDWHTHTTENISRETNGRHTKVLSVVIGQRLFFNFSKIKRWC